MKINDSEIKEQFQKKNIELFVNKLKLDILSNSNSLLLTMENSLIMSFKRIEARLVEQLDLLQFDYSLFKIEDFNNEERLKLNSLIYDLIKQKYLSITDFLDNNTMEHSKAKQYVKWFCKCIDKSHDDFANKLNKLLLSYGNKYILSFNENMAVHIDLDLSFIFEDLITKIISESQFRNNILKNVAQESFEYYLQLKK